MANNEEKNRNKYIDSYFLTEDFILESNKKGLFDYNELNIYSHNRLETRTRMTDSKKALSFGVHDPLWMLTRQWQFGEFKGDDAGSAILAKIKIDHTEVTSVENDFRSLEFNKDNVLEFQVEKMNAHITNAVRVDAAYYLKKSIDFNPTLKSKSEAVISYWQQKYPLESFSDTSVDLKGSDKSPRESIDEIKKRKNENLELFLAAFGNRSFDGYKVFLDMKTGTIEDAQLKRILSAGELNSFRNVIEEYIEWFGKTYLPNETGDSFWKDEKLGYDFSVSVDDGNGSGKLTKLSGENYHSGRLSWYSFDLDDTNKSTKQQQSSNTKKNEKLFTFIPTLAEFPGAPNKRLWAFEDAKVYMGNSELGGEELANALVLQYVTMYGNDWLLTPMELNAGMLSKVTGIVITDVFGTRYYIDKPVGDNNSKSTRYSGKWEMFTISKKGAYKNDDFTTDGRLFYPPSVTRVEESEPIEEVQFLRDEMANMLWAVETVINDGCGKTLDGDSFAADVYSELEELTPKHDNYEEVETDYAYLFQNTVPLNWIPFSPVKLNPEEENAIREIRFQRSTMPLFIKDRFVPIRPNTSLMRTGISDDDKVTAHKFINEEEIIGVGTRVLISNQRTRWFKGKTYNWIGAKKEISRTQANSGLTFDELVEVVSKTASDSNPQ